MNNMLEPCLGLRVTVDGLVFRAIYIFVGYLRRTLLGVSLVS